MGTGGQGPSIPNKREVLLWSTLRHGLGLGVEDWGQWQVRHGVDFGESVCIHGTQEIQWRGLHVCTCVYMCEF